MNQFKSFGAFAIHLEKLALEAHEVKHFALDKATEEIEKTAKGMIGDYQSSVGPFVAWEELADSTKAERASLGFSDNDPGYRTGEMRDSIKHTVEDSEGVVGSNDQHLYWFDLGTPKQPPRPVLGPAAMHSKERVARMLGTTMFAWLAGRSWRHPRLK